MSEAPDANLTDARRWLRQAEHNFAYADWNAQGKVWIVACFLCQQAGELALKSMLIRQGERVRIHLLTHLVERLARYYPEIRRLESPARQLDRYYMPTRYPDAVPIGLPTDFFNEGDFKTAHAAAAEVLSLARQALAPS
jgi:HEPN domain-containing protein